MERAQLYGVSQILHIARPGEMRNAYEIVLGRPERKGPHTVARRIILNWKINVNGVGRQGDDWMQLTECDSDDGVQHLESQGF
jgi:hypothetical protein